MGTVTKVEDSSGSEQFIVKRMSRAGSSVPRVTLRSFAVRHPSGLALTAGA
jgi:hypothetical protein